MDSSPPRPAASAASQAALPPSTTSASARPSTSTTTPGTKRPAPSLLPAFEPLSSSPALPRPLKRQNTAGANLKYPTPVPTSSTAILSSSPPRRPALARAVSERPPLSVVPTVELPENGETVDMGRSSNSSHFQLSANRLMSRVHVKARYIPAPSPLETNKIEIICNGWNGLKLRCQGRTWELFKGDSFTSETEGTDLMVDVLDARVLIQWPKRSVVASDNLASLSDSSWDDSPPPSHVRGSSLLLQSSPLRRNTRITSPESPTPIGGLSSSQRLQALLPGAASRDEGIEIYEDEPDLPEPKGDDAVDVAISMRTDATASFSSELSDPEDENDPDEENDPVVHSFGPFGANIAGRLASISTRSPKQPKPLHRRPHNVSSNETLSASETPSISPSPVKKRVVGPKLTPTTTTTTTTTTATALASAHETRDIPSSPPVAPRASKEHTLTPSIEVDPAVINHVVNQLAYSRLSSTPLSTIMQNLPADQKTGLTKDLLRSSIEATRCVGIIKRQGKDAAGKALESEYYYVPEQDDDEQRRAAVVDGLRKPSLRNCRKQHKQYYWKRPKTP